MRNILQIIFIIVLFLGIASCSDKQGKYISSLIFKAENEPDSALKKLSKIDQTKLSDKDYALYSLIYTMAQDKSGLDVDNDSLIRIAYNWYNSKPNDSLYAKCQYYMGKYYALNDSSEKALNCFNNSIKVARKEKDYYTVSMALSKISVIIGEYNPDKAILYAEEAIKTYDKVRERPVVNKVYSFLNLAECLALKKDKRIDAISLTKKAINIAKELNDSSAIADSFQDLCVFYSYTNYQDSAFIAAKNSYKYRKEYDVPAMLAYSQSLYLVDSLEQAKEIINKIRLEDYSKYGDIVYNLKRLIAVSEHNYNEINNYADSTEKYLIMENAKNFESKDNYYRLLIQKENARANIENKNKQKTTITTFALIIILITIISIFLISRQRMELLKQERTLLREEIKNKNIQQATMRNFLVRKIDIIKKLEYLKVNRIKNFSLTNEDWKEIEIFLNNTDGEFVKHIQEQYPELTSKDINFIMLIRLKLPVKTLALIYHIEEKSVRQKLFLIKPKLGLKDKRISAKEFIENF